MARMTGAKHLCIINSFYMQTLHEHPSIQSFIAGFAAALNTADTTAIQSCFSADAVFMPEGFTVLTGRHLSHVGNGYLTATHFNITFEVVNIVIDNNYAFVQANASATMRDRKTLQATSQQSYDFFVLKKVDSEWKIFRYMFNHVKVKQ